MSERISSLRPVQNRCFGVRPWTADLTPAKDLHAALACEALAPEHRQDLADVLPYLACGEVSAVLAFTGRLWHQLPPAARHALRAMAQDERRHAQLIEQLQQVLPPPRQTPDPQRVAMFFRRLESSDAARHLAHIAALDRAVCQVLHPLLRRDAPIGVAHELHRALCALRQDEARHVRAARSLAHQLGFCPQHQPALERDIQQRLQILLQPVQASLVSLATPLRLSAPEAAP